MPKSQKLALVVDDSKMQCKLLSVLLQEENYRVVVANNGASGVEMYIEHQPDLVLMDINMPIMDGFEATRRIKKLSGAGTLAPLIFITSMDSEQAFIDSVEAGGDSILVRPFTPKVFKAKIKAMQRISDLVDQVKNLQQEQQNDAELAEKMMSGVIEARNFALDKIGVIKKAATIFSGDIQLSALCPNGDINVLLGDFTGHGLRASIGAIPVTETFRAMTKKGFSILEIVAQLNRQMYTLLPGDLFFCASFACISEHDKSAYIFNAGLPDGYLFDDSAKIKRQFTSTHPPLGILPQLLPDAQLEVVQVMKTDRIVFITDGIVEARNKAGDLFGFPRFEIAAIDGISQKDLANTVLNSLDDFCQNCEQEDDISLVDVPCSGWKEIKLSNKVLTPEGVSEDDEYLSNIPNSSPSWSYHLHLTGRLLKTINPIPLIMNQINDLEGAGEHWQSLYTILTELFINGLDHGVLALDSSLKDSAEGFSQYFNERAHRLDKLAENSTNGTQDYVRIALRYFPLSQGGKMVINIKDSGQGFDILDVIKDNSIAMNNGIKLSGRGVELVSQLCDTLEYQEQGTSVTANYIWHN
ncbi:SpoIIE family protein phosphatase [Colwellia psychrerythraea]|uniref:Response regulator receiver protein n=1 Tax=Colwellia psychrerythraea TaxID=28229 RepID=A0A099KCD3_COLPS|nr:SpoIIE family protein phosphatase [Colwellia psychrerythraea]KGJ87672.1 response regulator receiver protein [Colwellia psychrerythraea]